MKIQLLLILVSLLLFSGRLCGLVPGYRSGVPGFDSRHYKKSSGSGTGSTQPREYNWGATWRNSSGSGLESHNTAVGVRHADYVAPSSSKNVALTSLTSGGRSVGIVRLRTEVMSSFIVLLYLLSWLLIFSYWITLALLHGKLGRNNSSSTVLFLEPSVYL
jgi:hypothetical protein